MATLDSKRLLGLYDGLKLPERVRSRITLGERCSEILVEQGEDKVRLLRGRRRQELDLSPGSIFLPMIVNPSDEIKTNLIRQTYAFANADSAESGVAGINDSLDTAKKFADDVVGDAAGLRRAREDKVFALQASKIPHFALVIGKKGVGKTHFQNFILSEFSDHFDDKEHLWIRINLIRDFESNGQTDISYWVKAQIAKVVIRYYDRKSEFCSKNRPKLESDYRTLLYDYLESHQTSNKQYYLEKCDVMIDRLQVQDDDEQIDPQWMPELLVNQVYRRAKKLFSISVVIDGLDLLTDTKTARKKYYSRLSDVQKFLVDDTLKGCFYLLFVRPKTLEELRPLQQHLQANPLFSGSHWTRDMWVRPSSAREIFYKRVGYLGKTESPYDISTASLRRFTEFVNSEASDVRGDDGQYLTWFELIDELAKENARSAIQALSVVSNVIDRIASSDGERKQAKRYHFIEHAMLGASFFPPISYAYSKFQDGDGTQRLARTISQDAGRYDTIFVPSVFNFPYPEGESVVDFFKDSTLKNYLLPLRILQFLSRSTAMERGRMRLDHLKDLLTIIYGFDESSIIAVLEEFSETEVIDIELSLKNFAHFDIHFYSAKLTVKGQRILDNFLYDLSYLTLCFLTAPLPQSLSKRFEVGSPKLQTAHDWVRVKVVNGLAMLSIIEQANSDTRKFVDEENGRIWKEIEAKNRYDGWKGIIVDAVEPNGDFFDFIDPMKASVLESAEKAIYGYEDSLARDAMISEIRDSLESA